MMSESSFDGRGFDEARDMTVNYDLAAFRRANFVGRAGALMELHPVGEPEPGAALTALVRAVNIANDVLAVEEEARRARCTRSSRQFRQDHEDRWPTSRSANPPRPCSSTS